MRTSAPALLPIFRSSLQARLLALVFIRPDPPHTVSDLARRLDAHVSTVQREVERLEVAGILETDRVARARLVRPGSSLPFMAELEALILKALGPAQVVAERLRSIPGIEAAYVFGSWAERYRGHTGPPPRDLDVLVVGEPDRERVYAAAEEVERMIGVPVDVVIRSPASWSEGNDPFIQTVRGGPNVALEIAPR